MTEGSRENASAGKWRSGESSIAIVGNMNNNGFALLRYFRDLGERAYLFPFADDGAGTLSHFAPEADSWDIGRWRPYIRQLGGHDAYVGSGIAPALLGRLRMPLDIFYPYSAGVEFVDAPAYMASVRDRPLHRTLFGLVRARQARWIRRARICLNAEMGPTQECLDSIGAETAPLAVPMVYNREDFESAPASPMLSRVLAAKAGHDLTLFCCSRHLWVKPAGLSDSGWRDLSKNTDWLLRGLADFLKARPEARPLLIMVRYGPDALKTEGLSRQLGLENAVLWLDMLSRKEILRIMRHVDIAVGEFVQRAGMLWGGTGWEALASGKPLLQAFNFSQDGFAHVFGHPAPPILDVKSEQDVATHLSAAYFNKGLAARMEEDSKAWFDRYNGIGLARKWLAFIKRGRERISPSRS